MWVTRFDRSWTFYQLFTGVITMKFSLAALVVACAVASPAFSAGFDIPPMLPPHQFDIPPMLPPHSVAMAAAQGPTFDIPPMLPPHQFDIPPMLPPHSAASQQNA
jgi:hypothetical protein